MAPRYDVSLHSTTVLTLEYGVRSDHVCIKGEGEGVEIRIFNGYKNLFSLPCIALGLKTQLFFLRL